LAKAARAEAPKRRGRPPTDEQAVLDAAIDLVKNEGAALATMDAIARRAGITKITLYRRWPSKGTLLADALLHELRKTAPLDTSVPPYDAIVGHVIAFTRGLSGTLGVLFERVIAESLTDADARVAFRDRYLALRRQTAIQIIRRGLADGSFDFPGTAEERHDELYGALFYRFLFKVGSLSEAAAVKLVRNVLKPGPTRQGAS